VTAAPRTTAAIDWGALHRRLAASERTAESGGPAAGSPAARTLLDERARRLARPVHTAPVGRIEVLVFQLAGERYALESRYVQAVFVLRDRAPLPGAQPPIHGVTAWRGELLTLLELRATFGLPVGSLNDLGRVVVLGDGRASFGILTDAVHSMVPLDLASLHPLPPGTGDHRQFLKGVTGDALLVIDAPQLLRLTEPDSSRVE
jgi:purine-binding chemotaxis protein CheW